jgi:hypothetical protein
VFDSNTLGEAIIALTAGASTLGGVFAWRKTKAEAADIVGKASDRAVTRAMAAMEQSLKRVEADLKTALVRCTATERRLDECEQDRERLHVQSQRQAEQLEQLERRDRFRPDTT